MSSPCRRRTRGATWSICCASALGLIATTLAATPHADRPPVAYEDPGAAGRPDGAIAILTWEPGIDVISIDGSAPDPAATQRRARLAPGRHAIYYFGTVGAAGECPPVTGDDLAEFEAEEGRRYGIAARRSRSAPGGSPTPGCHIELVIGNVTGPEPALWPKERLARARSLGAERLSRELQRIARVAAEGDPDAAVDLALWYLLGDEPLRSPDLVAAQAWLLAAADRNSPRAERMRAQLEPTLTSGQRQAAAELAQSPPLPALGREDAHR